MDLKRLRCLITGVSLFMLSAVIWGCDGGGGGGDGGNTTSTSSTTNCPNSAAPKITIQKPEQGETLYIDTSGVAAYKKSVQYRMEDDGPWPAVCLPSITKPDGSLAPGSQWNGREDYHYGDRNGNWFEASWSQTFYETGQYTFTVQCTDCEKKGNSAQTAITFNVQMMCGLYKPCDF